MFKKNERRLIVLVIREEQYKVFEGIALERFIDEMVIHAQEFSPILCGVIGEEQVRVVVCKAIEKAKFYEFSNRGPVQLFIDMSFLFGSAFDTDPQYPWAMEILNRNTLASQTECAEELYERTLDYNESVGGANNEFTRQALVRVSNFARLNIQYSNENLTAELLGQIEILYPQKVHYTGKAALRTLIEKGLKKANEYGFFASREKTVIVVLMFTFGHGCMDDPLYPWIANTLIDQRIIDAAARVKRLEKKSLTWLDHVLGSNT